MYSTQHSEPLDPAIADAPALAALEILEPAEIAAPVPEPLTAADADAVATEAAQSAAVAESAAAD